MQEEVVEESEVFWLLVEQDEGCRIGGRGGGAAFLDLNPNSGSCCCADPPPPPMYQLASLLLLEVVLVVLQLPPPPTG